MLRISVDAATEIRAHAVEGYPFEICGLLVGRMDGETRVCFHAWRLANAWEDDPAQRNAMLAELEAAGAAASADRWLEADTARRFLISPQDILSSMKRARGLGMDLLGVYHTHPNHPAVPSDFDRSAASPDWSYVILSVRDGNVEEFRSWVVLDDDPFVEELIEEWASSLPV